jgi:hypothetical protein
VNSSTCAFFAFYLHHKASNRYKMYLRSSILLPSLLLYNLPVLALQRDKCAADITLKLQNGTLHPNDTIFYRHSGHIMSDFGNFELTIDGCEKTCGRSFNWYPDVGPRLHTWLLPVMLLIGNLCLATLGKPNSIFTILHLLGDPIDSIWSLLTKLEAWNRCWDLSEHLSNTGAIYKDHVRDRGTILAAIQELEGPGSDPSDTYVRIINNSTLDKDDPARPRLHHLCREIANEISDSSVNEMPRTMLAILTYIFALLGAFVEAIGGKSSSQPGGRIASAIFLSWLVPVILLSNSIGSFTSRRTLVRILERFAKGTKPILGQQSVIPGTPPSPISPQLSRSPIRAGETKRRTSDRKESLAFSSPSTLIGLSPPINPMISIIGADREAHAGAHVRKPSSEVDWLDLQIFSQDRLSTLFGRLRGAPTTFDAAQPWFGGIYTYQSSKHLFSVPKSRHTPHRPFKLFLIAMLAPLAASVTAFLILWFTPTVGLTCRHMPLIVITLSWYLSTFFGHLTYRVIATGRYHWYFTLIKDIIVAIPSLLLIFLMCSGFFNSCYCWSSVWSRGRADAYIALDPNKDRKHNAETIYPALVWACLGFQAFIFFVALRLSKRGRSMMRKDEKTKMRDFWSVHRGIEGEEVKIERRWRRKSSGDKERVQVQLQTFSMLPPPAEEDPFLKR